MRPVLVQLSALRVHIKYCFLSLYFLSWWKVGPLCCTSIVRGEFGILIRPTFSTYLQKFLSWSKSFNQMYRLLDEHKLIFGKTHFMVAISHQLGIRDLLSIFVLFYYVWKSVDLSHFPALSFVTMWLYSLITKVQQTYFNRCIDFAQPFTDKHSF